MSGSVERNDLVALRETIQDLPQGKIGRVLEVLTPDEFEVEFVDDESRTIDKIPLKLDQIHVLRHEATIDETDFWKLIEEAKAESKGNSERQVALLVDKVAELSIAYIFAFAYPRHSADRQQA